MKNLFSGTSTSTIIKFIILSMMVGALLAYSGLTPYALLSLLKRGFEDIFGLGFDAFRNLFQYFLYGAMIVAPIWLVTQLLSKR